MKFKTIIFYSYYERLNETKNQTNLAFFIRNGLNNFNLGNIKVIFILNKKCEVECFDNIKYDYDILRNNKNNYTDFEAWKDGISFVTKKYKNFLFNITEYICCINCSVTGPFYNNKNWLEPFYNKMNIEKSNICSPIINFLKENDRGGPGPRIPSYFFLVKITPKIMNLLLNTKINTNSNNTKNIGYNYNTCVFGYKINRENWILNGEYGLTRILLNNGIKISCLVYSNINYFLYDGNNNLCKQYSHILDRNVNNDYKYNIQDLIFVKNNWRCSDNMRDSLPILYNQTNNYIFNKFNMKKLEYKNLDYNFLNIQNIGYNNKNKHYNWNDKEKFYNLYGKSEEFNIFPKYINNNNKCVLYFHYDKNNTIKHYVIESIKTFIELKYDIYFCTTCSYLDNKLPIPIYYFKNKGIDIFTLIDFLNLHYNKILNYNYITICNDSLILPINGILNMWNSIKNYRNNCDFWGIMESNEKNIHLMCSWIEYNNKSFIELVKFYKSFKNIFYNKKFAINNFEIKQTQYLVSKGFKYNKILSYKQLTIINKTCPLYSNIKYNIELYKNKDLFAIKYKYMIKNKKILNLSHLNYLTFYLQNKSLF